MPALKRQRSRTFGSDTLIFWIAIIFLVIMHQMAFEDRFILVLYYITAVGSAYSLVRRRARGLASVIVAVVAATMFTIRLPRTTQQSTEPSAETEIRPEDALMKLDLASV